jgi:hypothetical protein
MTAKNHGGRCCCGACFQKPKNEARHPHALEPLRAYCCACVPKQICVSYEPNDESKDGGAGIIDVLHPCDHPDDVQTVWRGSIAAAGSLIDIEVKFEVEGDKCYLVLSSDFLGETGDNRVLLDEVNRGIFCPDCTPCPTQEDTPTTIEFPIEVSGSGTSNDIVIHVRPASNTPLHRHPVCCECPDPCYPETSDEKDCIPPCEGCECICAEACLTVIVDGVTVVQSVAPLCNRRYSGGGIIVEIPEEPCCVLRLIEVASHPWEGSITPDDVPIGDDIVNPCPRPTATWSYSIFDDQGEEQNVLVVFSCSGCGGCDSTDAGCPCPVPKVLTVSVSSTASGPGSGTGSGGCCPFSDTAIVYAGSGLWSGEADTWCGGPASFELTCSSTGSGSGWNLLFTLNNCADSPGGLIELEVEAHSVQCEPLRLEYTFRVHDQNTPLGPFCCINGPAGGGTITIVITE